ncbi:MAG TPA: CotH kinase family protein [Polyangiales bacterium]
MKLCGLLSVCLLVSAACGDSAGPSSSTPDGSVVDGSEALPDGGVGRSDAAGPTNALDAGDTGVPPTQGVSPASGDMVDGAAPTTTTGSALTSAQGCPGVYNPDQLLTLSFTIERGDLSAILADTTYEVMVPAQLQCEREAPLEVGVRRKRSGGLRKVALKVDIDELVPGQRWHGLRKLSLENSVSEGEHQDADVRASVSEYLAWRLMVLSGAVSGRAALAMVEVNGEPLGVYVHVEQVDKPFLKERFGDDSGWLYKKSGGDDGLKTHELSGEINPYEAYFCFWAGGRACPVPASTQLAAELPTRLDIPQLLRFGAVNAIIANTDGPLFKDNNYYYYDCTGRPRVYIPWDLDTTMTATSGLYRGGGGRGGTSVFDAVLFMHWRDDYSAIARELLDTRLTAAAIDSELDRILRVAGDAFARDPHVTGTLADAVTVLRSYWKQRLPALHAELP